jgi:farnesyl-diphosphate farnesyltransferase
MNSASADLLTSLLRDVSRSFYTTLRILPGAIRPQIGLAYLLARATDTVADTHLVSVEQRLMVLRELRQAILSESGSLAVPNFGALAAALPAPAGQGSSAERLLLERVGQALSLLTVLSPSDRTLIREVLETIISGQMLDLERFSAASANAIVALRTEAELDDYTYRVAGCVGQFWTKMCRAHLFPRLSLDDTRLLADGIRFGKGLQLVNILRDLPKDVCEGRCYLPADELSKVRLVPADLLDPNNETKLRPAYDTWLGRAAGHLEAGWHYTNALPASCMRLRLACAWPALIGARTLARLRSQPILNAGQRVKVTRAEVRGLIARSVLLYPLPALWRGLFARAGA